MSWLKMETHTPDKPEIFQMAEILSLSSDDIFGKCFRVWAWFDAHTTNGKCNGAGVTSSLINRVAGVTGFADAMVEVGWMVKESAGLTLPNFERHNGETAKQRALTAKRVANKRNANSNAVTVTSALPREDKRRIDIYTPPIPEHLLKDFLKVRKAKRVGELTETAFKGIAREAEKSGITAEQAIEICCKRGWASFDSTWDHGLQAKKPRGLVL